VKVILACIVTDSTGALPMIGGMATIKAMLV
jgi:hypothetical protein